MRKKKVSCMRGTRRAGWAAIALDELAGRKSGLAAFDEIILRYDEMKREVDAKAKLLETFRRKILIPLARKEGFRKGSSLLLAGFLNSVLIERVVDLVITDQAAAAALPLSWRRAYLQRIFKPSANLKALWKLSDWNKDLAEGFAQNQKIRRFLIRSISRKRHWRVSRITVRQAKAASSRRTPHRRAA